MSQPLLAIQFRNGTVQVFRIVQAQPIALGNAIADTAETALNQNDAHYSNRVIQFAGATYAWHKNQIYKLNTGTSNWDSVFTQSFATGQPQNHSGLHKCNVNGVPAMVGIYNATTVSKWIGIYSFDGASWTEVDISASVTGNLNQAFHRNWIWKNQLWWVHDGTKIYFWDPTTTAVGQAAVASDFKGDFCIHKNRLYMAGVDAAGNRDRISEFVSGVWFARTASLTDDGNNAISQCVFPGGDGFMYAIFYDVTGGPSGFRVFKLSVAGDGTVTPTDITTTVLPSGYRPGGGLAGVSSRFWAFVDTETAAGSAPTIWLFFASQGTAGGTTTLFQWMGASTLMSQIDQGGDVAMAFPESKVGGGEYIFTLGESDALITGRAPVVGGERISFKLFGGGTRSFRMFYGTNGEAPISSATLASPSVGSLNVNNIQVDGLTADGTTVYQVTWLAIADGVPNQSRVQRMPRVF